MVKPDMMKFLLSNDPKSKKLMRLAYCPSVSGIRHHTPRGELLPPTTIKHHQAKYYFSSFELIAPSNHTTFLNYTAPQGGADYYTHLGAGLAILDEHLMYESHVRKL